jgi:predicted RNA-binding Zn-ribbon protein involved in translation (DUF1610 family)
MGIICPVCRLESTKTKCEGCGFEMPVFAFLSEDDAEKWHKDTVLPYRENWEKRKAKVKHCENCGKELQEGWKVCPYCLADIVETAKPKAKVLTPIEVTKAELAIGYIVVGLLFVLFIGILVILIV